MSYDSDIKSNDNFIQFPYDYLDKKENYFRLPLFHLGDMFRSHITYIGADDGFVLSKGIFDELYPENGTLFTLIELPGDQLSSLQIAIDSFLEKISDDVNPKS